MKHLLKITSAVLVLLLCALGGVFLWRRTRTALVIFGDVS